MADIQRLIPNAPAKVDTLLKQLKAQERPAPDLNTFNYATLTPGEKWESSWVMQLGHLGNNGPDH